MITPPIIMPGISQTHGFNVMYWFYVDYDELAEIETLMACGATWEMLVEAEVYNKNQLVWSTSN